MIWVFQRLSTPPQAGMDTLDGTVLLAVVLSGRGSHDDRLTLLAHVESDGSVDPTGSVAKDVLEVETALQLSRTWVSDWRDALNLSLAQ